MDRKTYPKVLSCSSICSDHVKNSAGEDLGKIEELMIDVNSGRTVYAVLSFGGFLKVGNKLFAIPIAASQKQITKARHIARVDKQTAAPMPATADREDFLASDLNFGVAITVPLPS